MTSRNNRRQLSPKPLDPIDWKEATRLYIKERLNYADVARRLRRSRGGIRYVLVTHGVPRHPPSPSTSGKWGKKLYMVWLLMKRKCRDRTNKSYRHFGARGIDFCPEWERFESFYRWAMESGYRPGKPLALKERARRFSPASCRWAPAKERVKLRLRLTPPTPWRIITAFGETKGVMAWARDPRCRVRYETMCRRIDRGYTPEDAISFPGSATRFEATRRRIRRRRGQGPKKRKPSTINWGKAVKLYVLRGMSPPRIARVLGVSYSGVLIGLKRKGHYRPRERSLRDARLCTTLHGLWFRIREICTGQHRPAYYSRVRGARLCGEWNTFAPFYRWALESGYRRGLCLIRKDRKAGFSPKNCAWISKTEASRLADHPPPVHGPRWVIRAFGETKGPTEWSRDRRCPVTLTALRKRLRSGMAPEDAITKPPRSRQQVGQYNAGKLPEVRPRRKARRGRRHGS